MPRSRERELMTLSSPDDFITQFLFMILCQFDRQAFLLTLQN